MDNFTSAQELAAAFAAAPWPAWLNWTLLIDATGLALAIIGFFNLAKPIEAYFQRVYDRSLAAEQRMNETIKRIFPLHKNGWRLFLQGVKMLLWPYLPALLAGMVVSGQTMPFWNWLNATDWRILTAIAFATPIIIFIWITLARILANRLVKYESWLMWRMIGILAYPPSGVLGTIGLLITVASIVLNRLP